MSDFLFGMHCLGIEPGDSLQISREFSKGRFPNYVLEQIIKNAEKINSFKSEEYPWDKETFNEMVNGFKGIVNSNSVLKHAEDFFKKHNKDLTDFSEYKNPYEKIANLLEKYMLSKLNVKAVRN